MHTALVCDRDIRTRESLKAALQQLGINRVLLCNQRDNALELAVDHRPTLLFLEAALPVAGLELAASLQTQLTSLVVLLVTTGDRELLKQASSAAIDSFLAKPLQQQDMALAVELAIRSAQENAQLRKELETAQTALKQRKQIEKAKGLLMDQERINEDQAFKKMRSLAMTRRITLAQLAEQIIRGAQR